MRGPLFRNRRWAGSLLGPRQSPGPLGRAVEIPGYAACTWLALHSFVCPRSVCSVPSIFASGTLWHTPDDAKGSKCQVALLVRGILTFKHWTIPGFSPATSGHSRAVPSRVMARDIPRVSVKQSLCNSSDRRWTAGKESNWSIHLDPHSPSEPRPNSTEFRRPTARTTHQCTTPPRRSRPRIIRSTADPFGSNAPPLGPLCTPVPPVPDHRSHPSQPGFPASVRDLRPLPENSCAARTRGCATRSALLRVMRKTAGSRGRNVGSRGSGGPMGLHGCPYLV